MEPKRRQEICRVMRSSVKQRRPAYSRDAHRAVYVLSEMVVAGARLARYRVTALGGVAEPEPYTGLVQCTGRAVTPPPTPAETALCG